MTVQQYGTKFSINAHSPQNTVIALEEGSIGIIPPGKEVNMLEIGNVAIWNKEQSTLSITTPENLEAYVAWHHSRFVFDDKPLGEIMDQLSLWYDMDVQFEDVGRYENINILLNAIEETSTIKFRIDKRKITIMNKY